MKTLTPKMVAEKVAEGWGYTQLAEYAEGTVEEVRDYILNGGFNRRCRREYDARLRKNDKRPRPRNHDVAEDEAEAAQTPDVGPEADSSEKEYAEEEEALAETPDDPAEAEIPDGPAEMADELAEAAQVPEAPAEAAVLRKDRLAELEELIQQSTEKVVRLEQAHKRLASERHQWREELRPLEKELREMQARVREAEQKVESVCLKLAESEEGFLALNKARTEELQLLDSLKAEREALLVVDIYVEGDRISDDMGMEFRPLEDWRERFVCLRDSELSEDYTIREIRVAARVMAVVAQFPRFALAVDSDRVASLLAANGIAVV